MRIAVASEGLEVSPVFGHSTSFTCYKIECGIIVECQNMPNPHFSPSRLASLLCDLEVSALITGSIERETASVLQSVDIEIVPNKAGTARGATEAYLAHTLTDLDDTDDEEHEARQA